MSDAAAALPRRDLPLWLTLILPLVLHVAQVVVMLAWPDFEQRVVYGELGILENLTVIAGLWAAVVAFNLARRQGPVGLRRVRSWFALVCLGCLYYVGEEISYGQHFFGWEAPGRLAEINSQEETNLHNLTGNELFDEVPRSLLLVGFVVGLVAAISCRHKRLGWDAANDKREWLIPTLAIVPITVITLLPGTQETLGLPAMPDSREPQELYIAMWLAYYCLSVSVRSKGFGTPGETAPVEP